MSNRLDVLKLIAEVEKRPILWDTQWVQHRVRGSLNIPWQEVAQTLDMKGKATIAPANGTASKYQHTAQISALIVRFHCTYI